jgi:hypothetical protein
MGLDDGCRKSDLSSIEVFEKLKDRKSYRIQNSGVEEYKYRTHKESSLFVLNPFFLLTEIVWWVLEM